MDHTQPSSTPHLQRVLMAPEPGSKVGDDVLKLAVKCGVVRLLNTVDLAALLVGREELWKSRGWRERADNTARQTDIYSSCLVVTAHHPHLHFASPASSPPPLLPHLVVAEEHGPLAACSGPLSLGKHPLQLIVIQEGGDVLAAAAEGGIMNAGVHNDQGPFGCLEGKETTLLHICTT